MFDLLIERGISFAKLAVEADLKSEYEQAVELYDKSIKHLKMSLPYIYDSTLKRTCTNKIMEYQSRSSLIISKLNSYFQNFIQESPLIWNEPDFDDNNTESVNDSLNSKHPIYDGLIDQQTLDNTPNFSSDELPSQKENKSTMSDLHMAINLSNQAKESDKKQEYQKSFSLYKRSIEYYIRVIEEEENEVIKTHMSNTVKTFIQRAEKIKQYLTKTNQFMSESIIPFSSTHKSYNDQFDVEDGTDIRIGLLHKDTSTTFWNDKNSLFMSVDIDKNMIKANSVIKLYLKLTNLTKVKVECIGICIKMIETTSLPDEKGIIRTMSKMTKLNKISFQKNGIFPLSNGIYEGEIEYLVPDLPPTEADFSTSYAREYFLVVQCRIPFHKDLPLEFSIRIIL